MDTYANNDKKEPATSSRQLSTGLSNDQVFSFYTPFSVTLRKFKFKSCSEN